MADNVQKYRLLTGSILAHEMMHAWLRLKGWSFVSCDDYCDLYMHITNICIDYASIQYNAKKWDPYHILLIWDFRQRTKVGNFQGSLT